MHTQSKANKSSKSASRVKKTMMDKPCEKVNATTKLLLICNSMCITQTATAADKKFFFLSLHESFTTLKSFAFLFLSVLFTYLLCTHVNAEFTTTTMTIMLWNLKIIRNKKRRKVVKNFWVLFMSFKEFTAIKIFL